MTVHCPDCASDYLLPERLLGSRGARVRCPRCGQRFVVEREVGVGTDAQATRAVPDPIEAVSVEELEAPAARPALDPVHVAEQILDTLAERLGARLEVALAEGKLWSAHGPELMRAWDAYRDAIGPAADAAIFRAALRTRWNVVLESRSSGTR